MAKDFADISRLELAQDRAAAKRDAVSKMVKVWESKNAKRALQGAGLSTMAVTLAACGGSDATPAPTTPTTPVTPPVVTPPAAQTFTMTAGQNAGAAFTGGAANDIFVAATAATVQAFDSINGGTGVDTLRITDIVKAYEGAAGLPLTVASIEALEISSTGGLGAVATNGTAAGTNTAAVQQAATYTVGGTFATSDKLTVTVNGVDYTATVGDASGTSTAGRAEAITAINAVLNDVIGDSVTLGATSSGSGTSAASSVSITAKIAGTPLDVAVAVATSTAGTATMATATASQTATAGATSVKANVIATGATAAAQVLQIVIADDTSAAAFIKGYDVNIGGTSYSGNSSTGSVAASAVAPADIAADLTKIINAAFGATVAVHTASTGTITITAPTAGTPLPTIDIDFIADGTNTKVNPLVTYTNLVNNMAQNAPAVAAGSEVVFDATDFADVVSLSATGDVVMQAADTASVTVATQAGTVSVDGGKTVTVTNTGTTKTTSVKGDALEAVSVTGGGAVSVNNNKTVDGTLTDAVGTTLTTVSLSKVEGASTVDGKAITTLNVSGPTTAASSLTVTNSATGGHQLAMNLNGVGYEKTYTTANTWTVTDTTATQFNIAATGKNNIDLGGASNTNDAVVTITMTGSGDIIAEVAGMDALQTIDASVATGKVTLTNVGSTVTRLDTGAGNDTFTVATTTMISKAGAGADTVTIDAAMTAGSSVELGAGDDIVVKGGSGSVATTVTSTKAKAVVDGGDGVDAIDIGLVNSGNASQIKNFETLLLSGTGSFDATLLSGITGLLQDYAGGATITNLTQAQSLTIANLGSSSATTTLTMAAAGVTGKSDAYTITLNAEQTSSTATPSSANAAAGTVAVDGIENITVVSNGTAKVWNSLTLGANNDAQTVVISGDNNLDLAFASSFGEVTSANGTVGVTLIDGSAATGKLNINVTNVVEATANLTVKGGSAADTFTTQAGDTITLTGGAGTDKFVVSASVVASSAKEATMVTITDFSAGETIDFATATITGGTLGAKASTASATTLEAALDAINDVSPVISWGTFAGNTYVVYDASGTTGVVANNDVVVKLEGIHDLSLSTFDTGAILTYVEVL